MLASAKQAAFTPLYRVLSWGLSSLLDRPIFILSAPRSGSTLLFECLAKFETLVHLEKEADDVWWRVFPYDHANDFSDFIGAESASPANVARIRVGLYARAMRSLRAGQLGGPGTLRYLDKTIANCFHLGFLADAFPEAQYLFLVRDPRAVVSSMIEGWPSGRFNKPRLKRIIESIEDSSVSEWSYPAPPGWQNVLSSPLPSICAWSWSRHIRCVLDHFKGSPEAPLMIRYEDLVSDTVGVIRTLANHLGLPRSAAALAYAQSPPLSRTTISRPSADKWRQATGNEIEQVIPELEGIAAEIGYDLLRD